eukprot:Plantae.Rhodophyta-Hildenbrandia_rubra.ctg6605.p1 GENE.Plantae.Rhodophyta-Hildenbrandia_rubra.ctg6605~~Plantae.Rhodophyta-Hildenbrandia_rubra.ctg6605.p1  ORF type:complete len:289 (+),score=50.92 Plantae.Rhodophyta-Hildenbrandia_rubra.ctg6605:1105-1971(+)
MGKVRSAMKLASKLVGSLDNFNDNLAANAHRQAANSIPHAGGAAPHSAPSQPDLDDESKKIRIVESNQTLWSLFCEQVGTQTPLIVIDHGDFGLGGGRCAMYWENESALLKTMTRGLQLESVGHNLHEMKGMVEKEVVELWKRDNGLVNAPTCSVHFGSPAVCETKWVSYTAMISGMFASAMKLEVELQQLFAGKRFQHSEAAKTLNSWMEAAKAQRMAQHVNMQMPLQQSPQPPSGRTSSQTQEQFFQEIQRNQQQMDATLQEFGAKPIRYIDGVPEFRSNPGVIHY